MSFATSKNLAVFGGKDDWLCFNWLRLNLSAMLLTRKKVVSDTTKRHLLGLTNEHNNYINLAYFKLAH